MAAIQPDGMIIEKHSTIYNKMLTLLIRVFGDDALWREICRGYPDVDDHRLKVGSPFALINISL